MIYLANNLLWKSLISGFKFHHPAESGLDGGQRKNMSKAR